MGDRGRLVIPAELRARAGLEEGRPLTVVETTGGLVLMTREQLKARVASDLAGVDLVDDLLTGRRAEVAREGS
jgi:AbrB family looped-hinge helix DNA binding protein